MNDLGQAKAFGFGSHSAEGKHTSASASAEGKIYPWNKPNKGLILFEPKKVFLRSEQARAVLSRIRLKKRYLSISKKSVVSFNYVIS